MQQNYQDAMAKDNALKVAKFGSPELFFTYTCNPTHDDTVFNLGNRPPAGSWKPEEMRNLFIDHYPDLRLTGSHLQ